MEPHRQACGQLQQLSHFLNEFPGIFNLPLNIKFFKATCHGIIISQLTIIVGISKNFSKFIPYLTGAYQIIPKLLYQPFMCRCFNRS